MNYVVVEWMTQNQKPKEGLTDRTYFLPVIYNSSQNIQYKNKMEENLRKRLQ